ncbi:phospholipase D family protein [Aliiruegeria lutimaris]|uniref:Phospholipase D n=1 Tax=Aliiruegeria lutimaris TaxID=571298 RepID=A0A1G9GAX2_9RHOB|nr:phospholipase D family protein [Aliiruegeria lutimaris]SDK97711.1 Phosphatidylserine/phosphatidylglycerophosphate/cardiolipin synthase [Aliiruegeria lutimaris]
MRLIKVSLYAVAVIAICVIGLKLAFPLPSTNFSEPGEKQPASWSGPLGTTIQPAQARNPGLDGVRPLGDGRTAFAARVILARQSTSSIDAQYYIWQHDVTGLMLLDELRSAAERGVRVRLLVDDNGISGMDPLLAELDALPTASVRIFNPFTLRNPKLMSYAFDFTRLNRRMHNKSMTFDGVATIMGGRNIGDIYFSYGPGTHYLDVDAIAIGPIVDEVSDSFDAYWNSASSYDAALFLEPSEEMRIQALAETARQSAAGAGYQKAILDNELTDRIADRDLTFEWSEVTLLVDDPAKGLGQVESEELMVERLVEFAKTSKTSLDLVSAYFIPGSRGAEILQGLARSGVKVRVLTNSLDATDVMPVHAAYMRYRDGLLESGVELLELRALRKEHRDRRLPEILAGSASGLHAKMFGSDGERAFIGSYNLDPRSARLNTEMGLLIESPTIAATLAAQLDNTDSTYRVERTDDGALIWIEEGEDGTSTTHTVEPETSSFQRGLTAVVRWLPVEWML